MHVSLFLGRCSTGMIIVDDVVISVEVPIRVDVVAVVVARVSTRCVPSILAPALMLPAEHDSDTLMMFCE